MLKGEGLAGPGLETRRGDWDAARLQAPAPHLQVVLQLLADELVVEDAAGHHEGGLLRLLHHELRIGAGGAEMERLLRVPKDPPPARWQGPPSLHTSTLCGFVSVP